jgi:hypothetical protein
MKKHELESKIEEENINLQDEDSYIYNKIILPIGQSDKKKLNIF